MLTFRKIASAVVTFGVSMSAIALALFVAFDGPSQLTGQRTLGIFGLTALGSVGYGASLVLARNHFRPDARVGGRRDAIAGILAIVLLIAVSVISQGAPPALRFALCLGSGAVAALAAHFPWLQRASTPSQVDSVPADA
jgi:hypothetical protein